VGFLDAGQGDCTVIVYPDNSITVIDCGSTKNGAIVATPIQQALALFLPNNNNTINNLVLTHADADHYNLVDTVLRGGNNPPTIQNVYYGCDLSLYSASLQGWIGGLNAANRFSPGGGAAFSSFNPDPNLSRGGVNAYILACNCTGNSLATDGPSKNANSLVIELVFQNTHIFLMGDGTATTENFIINAAAATGNNAFLTNAWQTALKMGHHGSNSSSSQAWIQAITPTAVFVSSDTRTFGGTGMPADTLLTSIQGWTAMANLAPAHNYVRFNTNTQDFESVPAAPATTTLELSSTLYSIYSTGPGTFGSVGGSWYWSVQAPPGAPLIMYGFTG